MCTGISTVERLKSIVASNVRGPEEKAPVTSRNVGGVRERADFAADLDQIEMVSEH